jgi:hypothetical protein
MSAHDDRSRVEANAVLLRRARLLLEKAHLRMIMLGDRAGTRTITGIIEDVEAERQRWLRAVDSSHP